MINEMTLPNDSSRAGRAKQVVNFLHIGKTGGTALKYALHKYSDTGRFLLKMHNHDVTLKDIPATEKVVFFLRDPIDRFISGFYSRQRQGRPRTFSPWRPDEERAFRQFHTPNELAVALISSEPATRLAALTAMKDIRHVRSFYSDWLIDRSYLASRYDDLFFIGFQESLSAQFEILKRKLGLADSLQLPTGDLEAHRNPIGLDRHLEDLARKNLETWYASDYELVAHCRQLAMTVNGILFTDAAAVPEPEILTK